MWHDRIERILSHPCLHGDGHAVQNRTFDFEFLLIQISLQVVGVIENSLIIQSARSIIERPREVIWRCKNRPDP